MTSADAEDLMRFTALAAKAAGALAPVAFCLLVGGGCTSQPENTTYIFRGPTMGTSYSVKLVTSEAFNDDRQGEIRQTVNRELDRINAIMSTYLASSEISRFNQHLSLEPFAISAEIGRVIRASLDIGQRTQGAFDITVAPLVNAWGFGPDLTAPPVLPKERLSAILDEIGLDKVILAADGRAVTKQRPELSFDLSGIAKGYAVDRVTEALMAQGYRDLLIDVGGEVRASGRNAEGAVWRLGIERPQTDPLQRGPVQLIVPLDGLAMATSGDYRNYREVAGERFSHILDPRDGRPIRHRLGSVSVVHEECMLADAWATALMVLGPEEGFRLASEQRLAAYFLIRDPAEGFLQKATEAFEELRGVTSN